MCQHILIATDGSPLADNAVQYGLALAKRLNVPATAVTVTEPWSVLEMGRMARQGNQNPITQYQEAAAAAAQDTLDGSGGRRQGVRCDVIHVREQHPARAIIAVAKDKGCDLIVMASHGRRGFDRILLGSQANEVLTHSKVPTLIVR